MRLCHWVGSNFAPMKTKTGLLMLSLCMAALSCKAQEKDADIASEQVNEYSCLSIEQLEHFIGEFEALLAKKSKRTSSSEAQGKVYQFYEGDSHDLNIYNLMEVMEEVGLSNQLFVLAQAVVETGHFKSHVCQEYHNLFGLRNPRTHSYYRFARWEDSVIGYQKFVQYKYKGGNYLSFLKHIGYAEAPNYVHTVAKVARQLFEKLQAEGRLS